LIACRTSGAWSDAVLKDYIADAKLDSRDAGLCTTLCCGVLQNRALLDYYIDLFLTGRKHLQPALRDILRLAVYQILFLDRIPDSAAVNEAVAQAKQRFGPREAGLCNGVLRNMLRQREKLEPPRDYAIRYSHPSALVDLMKASVGKNLEAVLSADNSQPETCVQVNSLKTDGQVLEQIWQEEGVQFTPHSWLTGCYTLRNTGNLEKLPSFQQGLFQVQDPAARLSVAVLDLRPGMRVLDLCAAPGGKSMAAAMAMENQGEIISCDVHGGKLSQIDQAARRLGVTSVTTMENDGTQFRPEFQGAFDAVIADVPCSGLGVIRKKPDIRYKDLSSLEALPVLQRQILENAAACVKIGGQLLYSTCTILKRENEAVVNAFLCSHTEFAAEALTLPEPLVSQSEGMLSLYQGIHDCDGFFLCRMRRHA
jgi:16S rRNA (cytosine967-C5)-methyltransferase